MKIKRIQRKFLPWIFFHFVEFIYLYLGALFALYMLHYYQAKIPSLAKSLGDRILNDENLNEDIVTFFIFAIAIFFFRTCSRYLFFLPARVQQKKLRIEIIELIQKAKPQSYLKFPPGQIYQILFNDFNRLRGFIGFALLQVGNIIIAAYVLIPEIKKIDENIFVAFTPMVASLLIFSTVIFIFQPYLKKGIDTQGDVQNTIIETFDAKESIASFQKEKTFFKEFNKISEKELGFFFKASLGPAIARPLVPVGVSLSLLWGAVIIHDLGLGATNLIMYSGFLFLVLEPLMFLAWIGVITAGALGSWSRVKDLLKSIDERKSAVGSLSDETLVSTHWDKEIAIDLKKGSILGFCGATGSGKSFLLEKIASILKDGGKNISLVMQEPHLFNDTVGNNILLGKELTEERKSKTMELLKIMGLDQLGSSFDDIMNTEVGENGRKLSGGQIKRLSLVRSLVSDCEYLVWDDPFSSVDNILEDQIFTKLIDKEHLKSKYLILSSHRLTTFRFSTDVYFLEAGGSFVYEKVDQKIRNEKINEFFKFQMA